MVSSVLLSTAVMRNKPNQDVYYSNTVYIIKIIVLSRMKFPSFGKKYKCVICGDKFKTEMELEVHRTKMHATSTP
jgi:hypothetical protein